MQEFKTTMHRREENWNKCADGVDAEGGALLKKGESGEKTGKEVGMGGVWRKRILMKCWKEIQRDWKNTKKSTFTWLCVWKFMRMSWNFCRTLNGWMDFVNTVYHCYCNHIFVVCAFFFSPFQAFIMYQFVCSSCKSKLLV